MRRWSPTLPWAACKTPVWAAIPIARRRKHKCKSPIQTPAPTSREKPERKLKYEKYLTDVRAAGSTDHVTSLELAFKMKPQLIYLLNDGDFEDNKKVLDKINSLQAAANPKVKINTIVFTDPAKAD